jgi:hypothetical protein
LDIIYIYIYIYIISNICGCIIQILEDLSWKKCHVRKKNIDSTYKTYNTNYEIELTIYKANHNKLWNMISDKLNIKV